MTAPDYLVRLLLRIGASQGREAIDALLTNQFAQVQQGGLRMISSATAGQSFSFGLDAKLDFEAITSAADTALGIFDRLGSAEAVTAFLARPRVDRARAFFSC